MNHTGLLFGAGASYDIGMPLAAELTDEIRNWLTPAKLSSLNDGWRQQGGGYSDAVIEGLSDVLVRQDMTYEHILGHLQVEQARANSRNTTGHRFLSEVLYALLRNATC